MTLPSSDSYLTYGGEIEDYSQVENPQTDLSAEASNSLRASVAGMSNTCFRAEVNFYADENGDVFFSDIRAVWDVNSSEDPIAERVEPGWYRITFPESVVDLRGENQDLNLLGGIANPNAPNNDLGYFCSVNRINNLVFDVFLWSIVNADREDMASSYRITLCVR